MPKILLHPPSGETNYGCFARGYDANVPKMARGSRFVGYFVSVIAFMKVNFVSPTR